MTTGIIGSGFSGLMTAINLLKNGYDGRILLFEKGSGVGEGPAYSTRFERHLLNVPAFGMSCTPDQPCHFSDWAQARGFAKNAFVPRMIFGQYLKEQFAAHADRIEVIHQEVTRIERSPLAIVTASGENFLCDSIVVALGNFKPQQLRVPSDAGFYESSHFQRDPWAPGASESALAARSALLIGTSLTAVDKVLEMSGAGRQIYAISRHGLTPNPHPLEPAPFCPDKAVKLDPSQGARGLLRQFRAEIKRNNGDWRTAVSSVRAATDEIWAGLSDVEKSRFLRHLRTLWDNHRHLIAHSIHEELAALQKQGELSFLGGRLRKFELAGPGARVHYVDEAGTEQQLDVDLVINCTGPSGNITKVDSPLLQFLLEEGIAKLNSTALGVEADADYRMMGGDGAPTPGVFVLGPLLKGSRGESIAVPELRVQAKTVANTILHGSGWPVVAAADCK